MIKFDIITIFPEIFDSYFKESLLDRAQKKRLVKVKVHNLRKYSKDRHQTVDDRPFGGGLGMVLKIEPIYRAVQSLKTELPLAEAKVKMKTKFSSPQKTILFTPRGKRFDQKMAYRLSKLDHLILICGRYEGVDERVANYIAHEKISIGDYDLMGGELPAMVMIEAISRLVPGVIGKPQLLKERITKEKGFREYPQYTRPEVFKKWGVPQVLLSGNHKKIGEWRKKHGKTIESRDESKIHRRSK